jgi:dolichol-phosphate mannosyltransferase
MDADLQHPPEVLTGLAQAIRKEGADLAIGSRYVPGGGSFDWTWVRRSTSRTATHMAATVLPFQLAAVGDPGSGMFMVRASALQDARLNPVGYKILLEVLAKAHYRKLVEVPYIFQKRERGSSKLGVRQYLEYLLHLMRLAVGTGQLWGWIRYGLVGLVGAVIDVGLFCFLVQRWAWRPVVALPAAILVALFSNFIWNETFVFRSRGTGAISGNFGQRALRYVRVCIPGALLNMVVTVLVIAQGGRLVTGAALGVASGGVCNFLFNIPSIWKTWDRRVHSR